MLIVPLVYGGIIAVREAISLARTLLDSSKGPPELPQWLQQLPWLGDWLNGMWLDTGVSDRGARPGEHAADHVGVATATVQTRPAMYQWTRLVGVQLLRRLSTLVFTLLTLYFVYLNRDSLARDVPRVGRRLFGPTVEGLMTRAADAIRATVDGIVLVAVAEGAIMAGVYAVAGAPHPILFGAVTGIFAMIPFAAPVVFGAVALLLASQNAVGAAIGVLIVRRRRVVHCRSFRAAGDHRRRCEAAVPVGAAGNPGRRRVVRTGRHLSGPGPDGGAGCGMAQLGNGSASQLS